MPEGKRQPTGDYEYGYANPPEKSRWKKGQSGNPSGKKRSEKSPVSHTLVGLLEEKVSVTIGNKKKRIPAFEALLRGVIQRGYKNDRAFREVMQLIDRFLPQLTPDHVCGGVLVVPAQLPLDEWEKIASVQQAPYRGNAGLDETL